MSILSLSLLHAVKSSISLICIQQAMPVRKKPDGTNIFFIETHSNLKAEEVRFTVWRTVKTGDASQLITTAYSGKIKTLPKPSCNPQMTSIRY